MLKRAKELLIEIGGRLVGYLGMIGFRYPVKDYRFKVSEGLWRGSRPNNTKLIGELTDMGIRRIINLCAEAYTEAKYEKLSGIPIIYIPVLDNHPPRVDQMVYFLNLCLVAGNQPLYVHCEAGVGRTGTAVACYRMAIQGWSADSALTEAKEFGLNMPSQEKFIRHFGQEIIDGKIELIIP